MSIANLRDLRAKGVYYEDIATLLNVSHGAIHKYANDLSKLA